MLRLMSLLLIGLLVLTSGITHAQDIPVLYCGDLSEIDCQFLNNSLVSLAKLHSAQIDLKSQIWQGDAPPIEYMGISGFLRGTVNLNMFQSSVGYYEFLRNLDADLTITAPRDLAADPSELISVNFMLIDDIFYIDLANLQSILNDPTLPAWGYYDLSANLDATIENRRAREEASEPVEPFATGLDANQMVDVLGLEFTQQYIQVTRTDAGGLVWFETHTDLAGLYADPTFQETFRELIVQQEGFRLASPVTDEQLDHLQEAIADLFPEPLVTLRLGVDLETGFLNSVYSWRPDEWIFTVSAMLRSEDINRSWLSAITFTLNLTDLNSDRTVTAPEGAEPFAVNTLRTVEPIWAVLPLASIAR